MKDLKVTFVVVAGLFLMLAKSSAFSTADNSRHEQFLQKEIARLFAPCPYEAFKIDGDKCTVLVSFLVDENKEITDILYQCENEKVIAYVENKLNTSSIAVPKKINSKRYNVAIVFNPSEL